MDTCNICNKYKIKWGWGKCIYKVLKKLKLKFYTSFYTPLHKISLDLNPSIPIISLNTNCPNLSIKRQRSSGEIKV